MGRECFGGRDGDDRGFAGAAAAILGARGGEEREEEEGQEEKMFLIHIEERCYVKG